MKVFLAGTSVSNPKKEKKILSFFKKGHKLHSYYHCKDGFENKWFTMNKKHKVDLFLDSGAFSAQTQGVTIDIYDYINFIKENQEVIKTYSNLDIIGDAEGTYKNQKIMEKQGLKPIPVFHYGEDIKWLKKYLKQGYDYLSLGGMVPISTPELTHWLDYLFTKFLTDNEGLPIIKIHGFGLTSFELMLRYPWYSVDSTSWVVTGRLGSLFIPIKRKGVWDYTKPPHKIAVSSKSPSIKDAGKHISNLSPNQKKVLLSYLDEMGYSLGKSNFKKVSQDKKLKDNEKWSEKKPKDKNQKREIEIIKKPGVSNTYQLRDELNILYYLKLEEQLPKWPWNFKIKDQMKGFF